MGSSSILINDTTVTFAHSGELQWTDDANFILVKKGDKIFWNRYNLGGGENIAIIDYIPFKR